MPTITIGGQSGTINLIKGSQYTIVFEGFGGWYGGKTKYLYDMNRATPLLLWSGDADNITLSVGNVDYTLILRAYDYCTGSDANSCYYPSNDIYLVVGTGSTDMSKCPRGDTYLRDLFSSCDPGYTLAPGILQNECQCQDAIDKGRIEPSTDWGKTALYTVAILVAAYLASGYIGGKK